MHLRKLNRGEKHVIKFDRLDTEKSRAAIESLKTAKISNSTYNTPEVNAALKEMFYGKCYICESKNGISSFQIEHLKPHRDNAMLKYDWNNLFLSCAHCNNIKRAKYEPILDCSKVAADQKIAFRKKGYFGTDESYEFTALEESEAVQNTIALLHEAYYGSTPQKKMEAVNIRRALRKDLSNFKNLIREYYEAEDYDKEDLRCAISRELGPGSPFTAFKRWLLWDNKEQYSELLPCCEFSS